MQYSLKISQTQLHNDQTLSTVGDPVDIRLLTVDATDDADAVTKMIEALALMGCSFIRHPSTGEPL